MISHAQYLRDPLQVQKGYAPELGGKQDLYLRYFGTQYQLRGLSQERVQALCHRFASVVDNNGQPSGDRITIQCYDAPLSTFTQFDLRGWDYEIAISYDANQIWISGLGFVARIERVPLRAELWLSPDNLRFVDAVENTFRVVCCYAIAQKKGAVVHSATLAQAKHAYVFFGPSGAGKTTLCTLSAPLGYEILSDELNVVLLDNDNAMVAPLPFAGDYGHHSADFSMRSLKGLYSLKQAPSPKCTLLSEATALAALAASCPVLNADPFAVDLLLGNISEILNRVTCFQLQFAKDHRFWNTIHDD